MWPGRRRARDPLNTLFDAALEFGANWRRDVGVLASERLPHLHETERAPLIEEVEDARRSIERWVLARWEAVHGRWTGADTEAARAHVRATYAWMDDRNVTRVVSQSTYYAWHG